MLDFLALAYPEFDPVAIHLGPVGIRWYALAYIAGILLAWLYCRALAKRPESRVQMKTLDDLVFWATIGIVLGGRVGYILFYNFGFFLEHPLRIFYVWEGGMSFHGGMLGVFVAMWFVARKAKLHYFELTDIVGCAAPIGLFLGRLANFVNGELYGRVTAEPWGMVFPNGGAEPRHPSQLYQAFLEGILLFIVLFFFARAGRLKQKGFLSGVFLIGYGLARIVGESFREPDAQLGFLFGPVTMGQLLSIPMVLGGLWLLRWSLRQPPAAVA